MRTVVFDLDGTLADTSGDLIAAANACFLGLGYGAKLDPVKDQATAFAGGRAMLRLGFSRLGSEFGEEDIDTQFPLLLQSYGENIDVFTKLYTNVERSLDQLADKGFGLGVCTNKPEYLAEVLLAKLGIRDRFGAMLGADTLPVRKPDPEHLLETIRRLGGYPVRSVLVGDTATDRQAAQNADVPCVLVTFGPTGRRVSELKPEALLDDFSDLAALVQRLIPAQQL